MSLFRAYYNLAKPGIVRSNVLSAIAGYFFASSLESSLWDIMWCALGFAAIIASACAANNILERKSDAKMERTKTRELPSGRIDVKSAFTFVLVTFVLGMGILLWTLTPIVSLLALGLFVSYVCIYTPAKSKTVLSTWFGTIPGALSLLAGYAAATGTIAAWDALLLFVVMAVWQMAHFYSIAIFRRNDYRTARLPVHPNVYGMRRTVGAIRLFSLTFVVANILLCSVGSATIGYGALMTVASAYWAWQCYKTPAPPETWARRQFRVSLGVLLLMCGALAGDGIVRALWL